MSDFQSQVAKYNKRRRQESLRPSRGSARTMETSPSFRTELWAWLCIAGPTLITNIARTGTQLTDVAILGHLSNETVNGTNGSECETSHYTRTRVVYEP